MTRSEPKRQASRRKTTRNSGCLPGFLLPPLTALCIGLMLAGVSGAIQLPAASPPGTLSSAPSGSGEIAPLFTPEVQYWSAHIARWANQHGLDPNLAATVMQIESCGHPEIRSSAGATGLFQVMPFHFQQYEVMSDPETNALRGLDYLRRSLETAGGNPRLAFAGYNGGIGVISRAENAWPNETIRYAYWGSGIYADASLGLSQSQRLEEWLRAGGASLCAKARQRLGLGN